MNTKAKSPNQKKAATGRRVAANRSIAAKKTGAPTLIELTPRVNAIILANLEQSPATQIALASYIDGKGIEIPEGHSVRLVGGLKMLIAPVEEKK